MKMFSASKCRFVSTLTEHCGMEGKKTKTNLIEKERSRRINN